MEIEIDDSDYVRDGSAKILILLAKVSYNVDTASKAASNLSWEQARVILNQVAEDLAEARNLINKENRHAFCL